MEMSTLFYSIGLRRDKEDFRFRISDFGALRPVAACRTHPKSDIRHPTSDIRNLPGATTNDMATLGLIEYADASPDVRAVYDDIMRTRNTDWINNFWKALAHDPATLRRTWQSIKEIMAPGALDAVTKEMLYLAISATNQCGYCIASHTAAARKAGMSDAMLAELMAVVGMANETNRLASGYQVEIDEQFKTR
jgi:AhpD family alkylhydroperoxidase